MPLSVVVKNLEKAYATPVLKGINLDVPQGQILGIIGRSGAGKSTLIRCLNGLEKPTVGSITIDGQPLNKQVQRKIGNIFQSVNLLSRLTALENIMFPLKLLKINVQDARNKALEMLELVGLKGKENSYPSELSGGQAQRVAIARALVTDVTLLLCDEFTSALDFETSLDILELLRDLNKRLGITIILITHDMAIVREICDEVCVIDDGKIVEKNNITNILLHPKNAVTKSLIRNLINKDLPHHLQEVLIKNPTNECSALVRLFFSSETSGDPIIAFLVKKYDIPINILIGTLDHIRETAFGSLIVSIPAKKTKLNEIIEDLDHRGVSAEVIGYLPHCGVQTWNS